MICFFSQSFSPLNRFSVKPILAIFILFQHQDVPLMMLFIKFAIY